MLTVSETYDSFARDLICVGNWRLFDEARLQLLAGARWLFVGRQCSRRFGNPKQAVNLPKYDILEPNASLRRTIIIHKSNHVQTNHKFYLQLTFL